MRYATKYAAKGHRHTELHDEIIEHLNKRTMTLLPPNIKQVLSHLILADCSHRAFIRKQELAYRVMNLSLVQRLFSPVKVVVFYKRANIRVAVDDYNTIEYSDRTEYSAYAERCRPDTEFKGRLTQSDVKDMTFNEFASTVRHTWSKNPELKNKQIGPGTKKKFRSRDINSGHWIFNKRQARRHTRPSTVLYTAPAINYERVEFGKKHYTDNVL